MGLIRKILFSFFILATFAKLDAQPVVDSVFSISQVPVKFVAQINNKIEKYNTRITSKTEKTLTRLSRYENKVHSLLSKINPAAAERLFGNNQTTFSSLLKKIKDGQAVVSHYTAEYDGYVDKLSTSIKYLQQQKSAVDSKVVTPLKQAGKQMDDLQDQLGQSEYIKQFIKERKKQLYTEAIQYIGKSKYLAKISKESYYYVATLKNYKELFSDSKKTEATVKEALNKIPAFQKFMQKNSQLASLFNLPGNNTNATASISGLQTRASLQALINQRIASGGPNALAQLQQNLSQAHAEMNKLKDKIEQMGGGGSDMEMPDFKPNDQKSKTLSQRLEYGFNVQFAKSNSWIPSTSDIGLSLGYKINNKSTAGIGMSYKLGLGSIQHIQISSQGLGFRSFLDWKIKKQFYISGGYEMNYNSAFKNIEQLKNYEVWQRSALIGLSKKYKASKKLKGNIQILYDFLSNSHIPVTSPVVFRIGYNF